MSKDKKSDKEPKFYDIENLNFSHTYSENNYVLDPHTAIGLGAAKKLNIENCIVLATAHPAKFPDAITKSISQKIDLPKELIKINNKKENFHIIDNDLEKIKNYIKESIQ